MSAEHERAAPQARMQAADELPPEHEEDYRKARQAEEQRQEQREEDQRKWRDYELSEKLQPETPKAVEDAPGNPTVASAESEDQPADSEPVSEPDQLA